MTSKVLIWALGLPLASLLAEEQRPAVVPFESDVAGAPWTRIDEIVFRRLAELGIRPARVCSDAVFVRRVYLDTIGTLPTIQEASEFLRDRDDAKRGTLIDRLLEREEFADYWAMRWGDLLRIKSEFPVNLWPNAVQAYHRWLRTCIRDDVPYDRFAREILTASGSNFRVPPVNFYRAVLDKDPDTIARAVALTFLGTRADGWPQERLEGLSGFFRYVGYKSTTEWKEEIVFHDAARARADRAAGETSPAVFPDGTTTAPSPDPADDPRELFADWLITAGNPWFCRVVVNRIWYWLHGRGIVHEPDDMRADNPAMHPELLELLCRELVDARYDLDAIFRLILNSTTYQLSSIPASDHADAEASLAFYPLRRLDAEVLVDALCQITGTTETYSSAIPEPFAFLPDGQRAIALADGSVSSSFLELFERPSRDTGLVSERSQRTTAAQRLHLLSSTHIRRKIEQHVTERLRAWRGSDLRGIATNLYLSILSRFPTEAELEAVEAFSRANGNDLRLAAVDLTWALINGTEFLFRH